MTVQAMEPHVFTLGIEEEFQIIDPETRDLRAHIQQILDGSRLTLKEHVKAEMHQSMVELGTEICSCVGHAREQVTELRTNLALLAGRRD
jgi:carboxylate-amine ligase